MKTPDVECGLHCPQVVDLTDGDDRLNEWERDQDAPRSYSEIEEEMYQSQVRAQRKGGK
jgi:hypothetical protein